MIGGYIGLPIGGIVGTSNSIVADVTKTLDSATLSSAGTIALKASFAKTLDTVGLSFNGAISIKAAASTALADASLSSASAVQLKASSSVTLGDAAIVFAGALAIKANIVVVLDDIGVSFQGEAGQSITDTEVIELPINCVLAGQQPYEDRGRTWEVGPRHYSERVAARRAQPRRISGAAPSFTTRISARGYD